jgi:hypothetical protein
MSDPSTTDDLDVIDSSGKYALTLGPGGHQIWNLDGPLGADSIATYPAGDPGFESAWDRYLELVRDERRRQDRLIRILYIAALVAEVAWMVAGLISTAMYYRAVSSSSGSGGTFVSLSFTNMLRFQTLDQAIFHIAIGLLAILLTIWVGRMLTAPEPVRPLRLPM